MASFSAEEDRVYEQLEEIPGVVLDAVLASEDRDFFDHRGIDPIGTVRALYADLRNEGLTQGGSTITQQYVKTVFLSSERTISRKLKEAVLAMKLERELSKEEILERYLNTIYFGRGAYGVGAAHTPYFDKDLAQVGPGEAAYLAGLIRAPESADAEHDPEEAERRRRTTLVAMEETGVISAEERDAADAVPIQDLTVDRSERTGGSARSRRRDRCGVLRRLGAARADRQVRRGRGLRRRPARLHDHRPAHATGCVGGREQHARRSRRPAAALVAVDDRLRASDGRWS